MDKRKPAAFAAIVLLAGCGGGGAFAPGAPARTLAARTGTVALSLVIPRATAANARSPRYLSVATKSIIVITDGGPPQGFDVSASSPNCTSSARGTTCTMSVIAPTNKYITMTIAAYDQPPAANGSGQGNVLSDGSVQLFVTEGADNLVQLSLGGKVATLALSIPDPHPWFWVAKPIAGSLIAKDAAGYTIVGEFDAKLQPTLTPASAYWQNSTPILYSYDGLGSLMFSGGPSGPVTFTVTAANGASASQVLTPVVQSGTVAVTAPDINIYVNAPYNRTLPYNVGASTTLYGAFATPRAVAFDAAGSVYMTDNGAQSSRSPAGPAVWVFPPGYHYDYLGFGPQPVVLRAPAFGNSPPLVVATDAANNVLYVATAGAIYRFALPLTASSTPAATISGPTTGLADITGLAAGANELAVSIGNASVVTFAKTASGDAAPQRTIAGAATTLQSPQGLAYDATGNLWVADATANGVAVFGPSANGNVAPAASIAGSATALNAPQGVAFDHTGVIYVVDHSGRTHMYAPGATGNATQQGFIGGANAANGLAVFP